MAPIGDGEYLESRRALHHETMARLKAMAARIRELEGLLREARDWTASYAAVVTSTRATKDVERFDAALAEGEQA